MNGNSRKVKLFKIHTGKSLGPSKSLEQFFIHFIWSLRGRAGKGVIFFSPLRVGVRILPMTIFFSSFHSYLNFCIQNDMYFMYHVFFKCLNFGGKLQCIPQLPCKLIWKVTFNLKILTQKCSKIREIIGEGLLKA